MLTRFRDRLLLYLLLLLAVVLGFNFFLVKGAPKVQRVPVQK
jgi:hypothetical protein